MKKDLFSTTRRNIIAISTMIVFLCLIVFAIITQILYSTRVLDNVDHQLLEQEKLLSGDIFKLENGYSTEKNNTIPKNFNGVGNGKALRIPPNLMVFIYDSDELEAMSNNLYFDEDNLPVFPKDSENKPITIEQNGYTFRGIKITNGTKTIQVLANVDVEMDSINRLMKTIIASLAILIAIALILVNYLASQVLKPVKEAYNKQVYFVQDASHEMRTPLAVIKGKLELLANSRHETINDQFEHISKMMSEIRGLEKLNSDLLLLSKEDLEIGDNIVDFKLNMFIDDISEFYIDIAELKEKEFEVIKPDKDIDVRWDYNKFKRVVIILLENAFKYTNEDGKILLKFEDLNKNIKITVKDNGIGIKEEEKNRIFDRFYRSETVRGENISGTGIGLSLLKSISKNFGIKIKVNSEYNIGTEFILEVPKIIKHN